MRDPKKNKQSKYIEYDYEEQYKNNVEELNEFFIEQLFKEKRITSVYAQKIIKSGNQLEIEIYPEFQKGQREYIKKSALHKKKDTCKAQKNLNDKNARKYLERKLNANFGTGDLWITFTYNKKDRPQTLEDALKDIKNYIRRLNYHRRKQGLPNAKYIYVTEYNQDAEIPFHHHVVMDGLLEMDIAENLWKKGRRNECRKIDPDENGIAGIAHYITDQRKGTQKAAGKYKKRWGCSTGNLKEPVIKKTHPRGLRKKVEKIVRYEGAAKEIMQKEFPEYVFTTVERYYNDYNAQYYIYVKMRKEGTRRNVQLE